MPDLSIVVVNFNTGLLARECLKSVFQNTKNITLEVFFVDNASTDGSVEMVKKEFPQVRIIANAENLYFTKANNLALRRAEGRYLMILNPDTFIRDNTFKKMVDFMNVHPDVGACGPKFLNIDGTLQGLGHRYPTLTYVLLEFLFLNALFPNNPIRRKRSYGELVEEVTREIEATGGACMMVKRDVAQKVGYLDEGFLMYAEETDWCYRIRKAGWKIYCIAEAVLYHYGAGSTEKVENMRIKKIFNKSMSYYCRKRYGFAAYLFCLFLSFVNLQILFFYRWMKNVVKNCKVLY